MMDAESIYVAHWSGLIGGLTDGNKDADCTWTKCQLQKSFDRIHPDFGLICREYIDTLMKPDCTVFDIIDTVNYDEESITPFPHEYEGLLPNFLGAIGWTYDYLMDLETSNKDWTRIIRRDGRRTQWMDTEIESLRLSLLEEELGPEVIWEGSCAQVDSLLWAMHTMTAGQKIRMGECIESIIIHNIERCTYIGPGKDEDDKDGKFDKLRSIFEKVENEEWDRDRILQVFNTQIASEAIVFCYPMADAMFDMMVGKEISELDLSQRGNQKLMVNDCRANYYARTGRQPHEEYYDGSIITIEEMFDTWEIKLNAMFNKLYYSIDRREYLTFLKM
jgi:hypothetical protein